MSEKTTQEALEDLRQAWLDLMYALLWPIRWLVHRLGWNVKPWVREREVREEWKKK